MSVSVDNTAGSGSPPADLFHGDSNRKQGLEASSDLRCSSPSSSIGNNSDVSGTGRFSSEGEDAGDDTTEEVQSSYKGGPLNAMYALEEVLPLRRGISRFYNGKSMSFASLAYASSSSSMQDLAKPENAYTRKRRNLLATNLVWEKSRSSTLRSHGAGISKRLTKLSGTKLALAVSMTAAEGSRSSTYDDLNTNMNLISRSSPLGRPYLAHHNVVSSSHLVRDFSACRSYSLVDLQRASIVTAQTSGSSPGDEGRNPS